MVEEALFVGVVLNFFVLKLSALVLKRKTRLTLISALVGEVVSLFAPLFQIHVALRILLAVLTSVVMLCISFAFESWKRFGGLLGVFLFATFIFGGACEMIESFAGSFPLFIVSIVGCVVYVGCVAVYKVVFKRVRRDEFVYKVKIVDSGQEVVEEGYLDSGNVLYDGVSGKPVMLITFEVFKQIYKDIPLSKFLTKGVDLSSIKNGHYIKINSVGQG